ncbi:metallophosphoesterase family protein [Pseudomonadota bacterium]
MEFTTFIVGSIESEIDEKENVSLLLQAPEQGLSHGGDFTGKPVTRIHISDTHVLKINTSGAFDGKEIANAWCSKVLQKDQKVGLYHPQKTWFVLLEDDIWRVGNIAPRMSPLHTHIKECDARQSLNLILEISNLYLQHAAKSNERLDEGLSNFGVTEDGTLYYLDDDFYSWDHFLSFTAMVAGWLRQFSGSWFSDEVALEFGSELAKQLKQNFSDVPRIAPLHIVYEHLGSQFMNDEAQSRVQIIRNALMQLKKKKQKPDKPSNHLMVEDTPTMSDMCQWLEEDEPIAILSDVHANEPALQAVLSDLKNNNIHRILCLGDIVGYGPHPTECIDLLCKVGALCLRGNHDHMVGHSTPVPSMHGSGLIAAQWTISHLDKKHRNWLSSLPLQLRHHSWIAVHGAPQDPTFFNAYVYDRTAESNLQWMKEHDYKFCLHGHSHLQGCFSMKHAHVERQLDIEERCINETTLICPGSVGQPRGGSTDAKFAVIHPKSSRLAMKHCAYDIDITVQDMIKHQLPDQLIQRLWSGI